MDPGCVQLHWLSQTSFRLPPVPVFPGMVSYLSDSPGKCVLWAFGHEWALCTAALLPELTPAPCFLSAIIGQID